MEPADQRSVWLRWHGVVLPGAAAAVLWIAALYRFRTWIATGDLAILQLRLERMGAGHIPLTGAFSRLDFHHPGPAREWVIGAAYHVAGGRSAALPATAILINLTFAGAALLMARRAGGSNGLAVAAAGLIVLHVGLGIKLHSAWNPYLAVIAGYAGFWGCVASIVDRGRTWVVPIVCASFIAQLHASALVVGGALVVVVLALIARSAADRTCEWRRFGSAGLLVVVIWAGPLVDVLRGSDSNAARMLGAANEPGIGISDAIDVSARLMLPWSQWAGETSTPPGPVPDGWSPLALLAVLALGIIGWFAWRRCDRYLFAMSTVSIISVVMVTVSFSMFSEPVYFYLFAPVSALLLAPSLVVFALVLAHLSRSYGALLRGRVRVAVVAVLVALTLVSTVPAWTDLEPIVSSPLERGVEGAVERAIEPDRRYTIISAGMVGASTEGDVALAVQRHGARPRSDQFSLDLPPPSPGSRVFIVAMTDPLACLDVVTEPDEVIVREVSRNVALPVGVFLIDPGRTSAVAKCIGNLAP